MNENKKGVRAPIRTTKPRDSANHKTLSAKANAAGPMKDKKKAEKRGEVKHKNKEYAEGLDRRLQQALLENSKPDHEAKMAKGELLQIAKNAMSIYQLIHEGDNLDGWVASYITVANDHLNSVQEQMSGDKAQGISEAEGDPEGLPHLTKELASHIADQINTEGSHAVVKSVEWGDGAADELVQFIQHALKEFAGNDDITDEGYGFSDTPKTQQKNTKNTFTQKVKHAGLPESKMGDQAAAREKKHNDIEAKRQSDAKKGKENMKGAIDRLAKQVAGESWTHDSLADQLFEHERTYEEKLQNQLDKLTKK